MNRLETLQLPTNVFGVLAVFTVVLLLTRAFQQFILNQSKPINLPPGPRGYPVIGDLYFLTKYGTLRGFQKLREQYGNVYSIRLGLWPTVVISGQDAYKEALCMEQFSDRPLFFTNRIIGGAKGMVFGKYNARWTLHPKIAGNALKMFTGTRNNPITEMVQEQADNLVSEFLQYNGEPFVPDENISFTVGSIIYQVVYGRGKHAREDKELSHLILNFNNFKTFTRVGNPFDVIPFLVFFMPWKYKGFISILLHMYRLSATKISEHKKTYDAENLRDATDGLICATETYSLEEKQKVGLTNKMIMETLNDYIGAGFDTVASTLSWGFLYIAENPEIQTRAREEIDRVIGCRTVTLQDRPKLPYTEALVLEVLRTATTLPLAIPHATTDDVNFRGYHIPRNTVVIFDLYGTSFDANIWENPQQFKPNRFLREDGTLDPDKVDLTVSFGFGKRRCLGENLARIELFLFLANVLQKCRLEKPPGEQYEKEGLLSFVRSPPPYRLIVKPCE